MNTIREEARKIPVAHETDICVVGGSCTGVFAAVRAARLGARVAIIESRTLPETGMKTLPMFLIASTCQRKFSMK